MPSDPISRAKLPGFVSFAHNDSVALEEFRPHLKAIERAFDVTFWVDDNILPGRHWRQEIARAVEAGQIFLLLVSHHYLASDFIDEHELRAIETRLRSANAVAIPVILEPCRWENAFGTLQATPTIGGKPRPIAQWERPHDGYDRACQQIEALIAQHFGRQPGVRGLANPFPHLREAGGDDWVRHSEQLARDVAGGVADVQAARQPDVAQLHDRVTRQAEHFAGTAMRLDNLPGWSGIRHEARRLADAVKAPADAVPGQVAAIYAAIASVARFLEMDRRIRGGESLMADALDPIIERELSTLVETAAIWIRQYPRARALDDDLSRWRAHAFQWTDAAGIVQQARTAQVISASDAAAVAGMLGGDGQARPADDKAAVQGALGVRNLLYRSGGVQAEAGAGQHRSPLTQRVGAFLASAAPAIGRFVADLPPDVRQAFAQLLAGETFGDDNTTAVRKAGDERPPWADDGGTDQYGRWVSFGVPAGDGTTVVQRMRWIPPGRFIMGSDGEPGRYEDEGPRHPVAIADGFWLFDTPCTQALWLAVMDGDNPSRFQSPTRPVEQVTFRDVMAFIKKVNALRPGLNLELPSEARWEYACRAGTVEATYAGPMEILGANSAPLLDSIAWYGGNSGVGFELDNGHDLTRVPERQHPDSPGGTHPVGQKAPNQWGLYDMLGNVWEWCTDQWHDSYDGAPDDGSAWTGREGAANRVIRGGSWDDGARRVRAACRYGSVPANRHDSLGFRCARVSSASPPAGAKRRAGRSKPGERSEPAATTSPKRRR